MTDPMPLLLCLLLFLPLLPAESDPVAGDGVESRPVASDGGGLGIRNGGGRKRCVGRHGGSRASEQAVEAGLRFLVHHQSPDGRWDVDAAAGNCREAGPRIELGSGRTGIDGDVLLTSEVLLGFLGAGYEHRSANRFQATARKGLDWLIGQQAADGSFAPAIDAHATALRVLAEAYTMTSDPDLRQPCMAAIAWLRQQQRADGSWGGELTSSIQALEALRTAWSAHLEVGDSLDGLAAWLEGRITGQADGAAPQHLRDGRIVEAGDADGDLLAAWGLVLLERGPGDAFYDQAIPGCLPILAADGTLAAATLPGDLQRLGLRGLVVFRHGDAVLWQAWNQHLRDPLIAAQRRDPACFDGSWDPRSGAAAATSDRMGRLLSTCRAIRILQTYYSAYQPWRR